MLLGALQKLSPNCGLRWPSYGYTVSVSFTAFSSGKAVIAGLEFNDKGLILVHIGLISIALGLAIMALMPLLLNLYEKWKPREFRFRDMCDDLSSVRDALLQDESVEVPSGINAQLNVLNERLHSLAITAPPCPRDMPSQIGWPATRYWWKYYLGDLVVYSKEGNYKEANLLHREVASQLRVEEWL